MSDEQFHEFQLDGKQLVFLFMTGTVVAVVIFLCGVLVGRGVQTARAADMEFSAAVVEPELNAGAAPSEALPDVPASPPPTADELPYTAALHGNPPPAEALREPMPPPVEPVAAVPPPPPPVPVKASPAPARAAETARPRGRLVIQVTALARQTEAESLKRSLLSKGYPAFVERAPDSRFRVRVGPFGDRKELDRVRRRLESEGQFTNLWVPPS